MPLVNPAFRAYGNINPSRFVSIYTSADFTVQVAGSGARSIGISQDGSKFPQTADGWGSGASTVAAEDGDQLTIFGLGEVCLLDVDNTSSNITAGSFLMPKTDGSGQGVLSTSAADTPAYVGAIALEAPIAGNSSSLIRVQVVNFSHTP